MATPEKRTAIEDFKRATSSTMRVLAMADDEIEVVFGPDAARMDGNTARLQMPARNLPASEVAQVRGESDAMALKKRHHDPKIHRRFSPKSKTARAVFDSVEQVRCEALGSRYRAGVADNLQAALEELPEKQRQVFVFRYYDELSYKEISKIVGTSVGGLKASYHHAVKKIEIYVKENID